MRLHWLLLLNLVPLAALTPRVTLAQPAAAPTTAASSLGGDGAQASDVKANPVAEPAVAAPTPADSAAKPTLAPADAQVPGNDKLDTLPENAGTESFEADRGTNVEPSKLDLYGFADFSYVHMLTGVGNIQRQNYAPYPSFYVGHVNLYWSSQLAERWRSLAEVRFLYSPMGDEYHAGTDGTFPATDTAVFDYAEGQHAIAWGGIEVQRAWLEYQALDFLTIRGGQWLTPYGYWNDDHGSPTIISVHKPFAISDAMFPERQTGLVAYGSFSLDSLTIGYSATLSNGRGKFDAVRDLDNNKAVGGRLYVETKALGTLSVGLSGFRGRYTASTKKYRVTTSNGATSISVFRDLDSAYDELSLGADLRWLYKSFHLQGELLMNEAAYDEKGRPRTQNFDARPTFAADYRRWGGYALAGYRISSLDLMPYAILEYDSFGNIDLVPAITAGTVGLNLRPAANVVLKAEYSYGAFDGPGSAGLGNYPFSYIGTQAAWAF